MSGSGNDFIVIDNRRWVVKTDAMPELARDLCTRRFSVGADGLILIQRSRRADFSWSFFNADGSEAAMCGNGGRCAARFAYLKGIAPEDMRFETGAGLIRAEIRKGRVKLQLPLPHSFREKVPIEVHRRRLEPGFLVVGVPHAVVTVDQLDAVPVEEWGRAARFHPAFAPEGANVNFFQVDSPRRLRVRTYERGVEGETLACGTGAVATALIASAAGRVRSPVRVTTQGGEELTVHFRRRGGEFGEVFLEGEARLIYEGRTWDGEKRPVPGA